MVQFGIKPLKPLRLRERRHLTIIAGFRCYDGVVVCADTQETSNGSKKSIPKLRFEEGRNWDPEFGSKPTGLAAAFCGSSDNGPFVDKLIDRAWEAAKPAEGLSDAADSIEAVIKNTYEEFGQIYQPGQCPGAELIYGLTMDGQSRLFSAYGPIVNECEGYISSGIGYYLADFLAERMYARHLTTRQCVILAAYILFQTKTHVEGCGGDSHIAVLREYESSGMVNWKIVDEVTKYVKMVDKDAGELLLTFADFTASQEKIEEESKRLVSYLGESREHHIKEIQDHQEFWRTHSFFGDPVDSDDLGLPKLPKP